MILYLICYPSINQTDINQFRNLFNFIEERDNYRTHLTETTTTLSSGLSKCQKRKYRSKGTFRNMLYTKKQRLSYQPFKWDVRRKLRKFYYTNIYKPHIFSLLQKDHTDQQQRCKTEIGDRNRTSTDNTKCPVYIFPCIWNAFKEQQLFKRNYVYIQDVLAEYLFDLDNPHVQKHDFNICMMYFTLHNWMRVSFLVIGSFIAKKFDIFRDIYERMKYNMCIMNNSIHHISSTLVYFPTGSIPNDLFVKIVCYRTYKPIMLWNKIDIWNIVYDINGITDESGEMEMKITSNVILKHISRNDRMSLQQWVKRYTLEQHNKEIIDGCFFNYKSSRFR